MKKRSVLLSAVALFAVFALLIIPQGSASAAPHIAQRALVTCSGHGCDGKDPAATGCSAGATHLGIVRGTWEDSQDYNDNQVWWSNACQSNFGYVQSFSGQPLVMVAIYRSDQTGVNCNSVNNYGISACTVNGQTCYGINGCNVSSSGGNALVYSLSGINTKTWETDLLYAPTQQVQVCQLPQLSGDMYCSAWH